MKVICFLGKLATSIFIAAIIISVVCLLLVSMVATALILHGEPDIHVAWTIPTIVMVIIAICGFIGKIYHDLFG